jgi:hypothetical protein
MEPKQEYREAVMAIGRSGYTVISPVDREALELILKRTGLSLKDTVAIEDEVLSAFKRYEKLMVKQGLKQYPLSGYTKKQLEKLQQILNLTDTDISELNNYIVNFLVSYKKQEMFAWGGCLTILVGIGGVFLLPMIILLIFGSDSSPGLIFGTSFISGLLAIIGFIFSTVTGNNANSYESYMVMRYGENWK